MEEGHLRVDAALHVIHVEVVLREDAILRPLAERVIVAQTLLKLLSTLILSLHLLQFTNDFG